MDAIASPLSRRESGKSERRRRIVEAAAALLREAGTDDVAMTQIAKRAGIAPATLYNLFQTKGAILRQVFDLDLEDFVADLSRAPAVDGVERLFVAIELAAALYERDPTFYRVMARVGDYGQDRLRSAIRTPRTEMWRDLVEQAIADGSCRSDTAPALLAVALDQLMRGIFLDWAAGAITARQLRDEAVYGFALLISSKANAEVAARLTGRQRELEAAQSARTA